LESESVSTNEELIFVCRQNLISFYVQAERVDSANAVHLDIAADFMESGETHKAITEYHLVLKNSRNTINYKQTAEILSTIGSYYQLGGNYKSAIRFFASALHTAKKSGNGKHLFKPLTDLGNMYAVLEDDDQSISCYELAVEQAGDESSDLPVSYICTLLGSQYQKRDQMPCAYTWFEKAAMHADNSIEAKHEDALQDFATAQYKLACLEFELGKGPQAETRLGELLQFCSLHELPVSEALATIQLVRVRLKSGSAAGSLPLLQEQVDKIRRTPGVYPPECFMVFKLIGDHCKYFLKDTASAERFYALYMKMSGGTWKTYLPE